MDRKMMRGEVWWADLGEPKGSQPSFRRPVVIVQDDLLTQSRLSTIMVVPLTTNLKRGLAVGNVPLDPSETGLSVPSVALVCQVMTVDRAFFADSAGTLPRRGMKKIDVGLRLALGLSS
jgi:mRNA interferase MazF